MGPGDSPSLASSLPSSGHLGDALSPPVLAADEAGGIAAFLWRREVDSWVNLVNSGALAGHKAYVTTKATLAHHLYRSLPASLKRVWDESIHRDQLDLSGGDQIATCRTIVDLVAADSPLTQVTRQVATFHDVLTCKRGREEKLLTYVTRFHGLASFHLVASDTSSSSHLGDMLALILLANAHLPENLLTSAKQQLLAIAERSHHPVSAVTPSVDEHVGDLTRTARQLKRSLNQFAAEGNNDHWAVRQEKTHLRELLVQLDIKAHIRALRATPQLLHLHSDPPSRSVRFRLADAVAVLRSMDEAAATGMTDELSSSGSGMEQLLQTQVQRVLLAQKPPPRTPRKFGVKRGREEKETQEQFCFDCGQKGHIRESLLCPSPSFISKRNQDRKRAKVATDTTPPPTHSPSPSLAPKPTVSFATPPNLPF